MLICFYLFIFVLKIIFLKCEKLIFVETFSRHGARGPIKVNDDGLDLLANKWSNIGELTPTGKRMEYLLGVYNRDRYITGKYKFLSEKYDPHELLIYSSDVNRTLLSITAQLQGLFPMSEEKVDKLNKEQINMSFPQVDITCDNIEKEIENLNDSALPNYMTVIPIHFLALKNPAVECDTKVKAINNQNAINKKIISNLVEEFNKNYSMILNNFYGRPKNFFYDFSSINPIFDALVVDLTEGNDVSNFFRTNKIDMNNFIERRYEVLTINFRDYIFGDDNNEIIKYYNTFILRQMIYNMKRKIDDDIIGNPSLKNVSDYSRPKMVIVSAHDTTLSAIEMFFIRFFGIEFEKYEFPKFTSQIIFEITRDDDIYGKKLTYSDYKVSYYFNDKLLLNKTFDEFVKIIEREIWNDDQINRFCFGERVPINKEKFETNLIIIIIMGLIVLILIIAIIYLVIKLSHYENRNENNILLGEYK